MRSHHTQIHGEYIANVEVNCSHCGKEFSVHEYKCERSDNLFCSKECQGNYYSDNNHIPPQYSGKEHPQYDRIETSCDYCGKQLKVQPHIVEKNDKNFCNNDCRSSWQSENIVGENHHQFSDYDGYYGENWYEMRRKCMEEYDEKCNRCDVDREKHIENLGYDLSVHHKKRITTFDEAEDANYLDNLELLCKSCHINEHN